MGGFIKEGVVDDDQRAERTRLCDHERREHTAQGHWY